jgi:uncharacterized protein YjiS (DUF1127 family)
MTLLEENEPSGRARLCADALRDLGWSSEDIEKILAGPRQSSIHDIAGQAVEAWSVDTIEAFAVPEPSRSLVPASEDEAPLEDLGIGQKDIADAVWASVAAGDPIPLAAIALKLKKLPGPLQAYLLACSREVKRYYNDLTAWKRDFDRAQREGDAQRGKARKEGAAIASGTAGVVAAVATAAAVANAVPVVGQVVSAVLALGLAIGTAITEAYALPVRKAEDQIRPGYEGSRVFFGFAVEAPESPYADPYLKLKQAVVQDAVAFRLPVVRPRTRFDFAPRLSAFQAAAHELGLYPEDENRHD